MSLCRLYSVTLLSKNELFCRAKLTTFTSVSKSSQWLEGTLLTTTLAPLFNAEGNVVFFLGGQINCSTTIHNCSDVLRILSTSDDVEEEKEEAPLARTNTTSRLGFFKSFRSSNRNTIMPSREAGMEQGLLNRIEKMNLKGQMSSFYTAYSKVLSEISLS
jgi:hypothetical protein